MLDGLLLTENISGHLAHRLEGLIVARIFELSKMNRAGTGKSLFL